MTRSAAVVKEGLEQCASQANSRTLSLRENKEGKWPQECQSKDESPRQWMTCFVTFVFERHDQQKHKKHKVQQQQGTDFRLGGRNGQMFVDDQPFRLHRHGSDHFLMSPVIMGALVWLR
jgi:hypothetical protein